jgi:hypothetical protein
VAGATSSKARSKKKTKKKINISNIRNRLYSSVQKRARRLAAAGDIVVLLHMPLSLNGKLRTLFQGLTQQQVRAILASLMDELEWDDPRLQRKHDECATGAVMLGQCMISSETRFLSIFCSSRSSSSSSSNRSDSSCRATISVLIACAEHSWAS